MARQRNPIEHGTDRGYGAHRRHGIPACDACKQAHSDAQDERRRVSGYSRPARLRSRDRFDALATVPGCVFVCECGLVDTRITRLTRHTWEMHGRPPLKVERVPQPRREVA